MTVAPITGTDVNSYIADTAGNKASTDIVQIVNADGTPFTGGGSSVSPNIAGGEYNSTQPTLTNLQTDALQLDSRGSLRVSVWGKDATIGSDVASNAADASGALPGLVVAGYNKVYNGTSWDRVKKPNAVSRLVSAAASTDPTSVKAGPGDVFHIAGFNANAAARYLKLYNKASAPTVGTDIPFWTEYLAPQAKFTINVPAGMYFSTGIAYAITTGSADSDTGALTAGDILALNIAYA